MTNQSSRSTSQGAGAFLALGITWAALVPLGLYFVFAGTGRIGVELLSSLIVRVGLGGGALWLARRLRRGPALPAPPAGIAAAYAVFAVLWVLHGVSKAAAPRSALGFLKLGSEGASSSFLFPDVFYARYASGPAGAIVALAALTLVMVSVVSAVRVARATR